MNSRSNAAQIASQGRGSRGCLVPRKLGREVAPGGTTSWDRAPGTLGQRRVSLIASAVTRDSTCLARLLSNDSV
jgi:hypothetical protein